MAAAFAAVILLGGDSLWGLDRQPDAARVYSQFCARCHGRSGRGDGPAAAALNAKPHSFDDCGWMSIMSNATLFLAIKQGAGAIRPGAAMPAYESILSYDDMAGLVNYIRRFCKGGGRGAPGGETLQRAVVPSPAAYGNIHPPPSPKP